MAKNEDEMLSPRRVANRIRDAYTLTEAEGILNWYTNKKVEEALTKAKEETRAYIQAHPDCDASEAMFYMAGIIARYRAVRLKSQLAQQGEDNG